MERAKSVLKELRKQRGYTQQSVADVLGVTKATISKYETGQRRMNPDFIEKLSKLFEVEPIYILTGKTNAEWAKQFEFSSSPLLNGRLEEKLSYIGYSIGTDEEGPYIWINYPDGTLEVTEQELQELDENSDSFLRFQLAELRRKKANVFRVVNQHPIESPTTETKEKE